MHCMSKGGWDTDMRPVMDVLYEAKEKGRVRAVGVSCHGFPPLVTSSDCDWIDVHLVRINPFGDMMDDTPEKVAAEIKKMHDRGHGVLGMKIFGETGFDSPEKRLQSLKYVLGLGTRRCLYDRLHQHRTDRRDAGDDRTGHGRTARHLEIVAHTAMETGNDLPRFLRRLGVVDQLQVLVGDHAFVGQELEVDHLLPVLRGRRG